MNGYSILNSAKYLSEDVSQNQCVFYTLYSYFTTLANDIAAIGWIYKWLLNSIIKPPTKSDYSVNTELNYTNDEIQVRLIDGCLKQERLSYSHGKRVYL